MGKAGKHAGGRPVKAVKRSKFVNVRFTEGEVETLERLEKELGLSRTDYIRKRTLEKVDVVILHSRALIASLDDIGRDIGYIGNNINQLARHAHTLHLQHKLDQQVIVRFNDLFETYLSRQQSLERVLRKALRSP